MGLQDRDYVKERHQQDQVKKKLSQLKYFNKSKTRKNKIIAGCIAISIGIGSNISTKENLTKIKKWTQELTIKKSQK